MTCAELIAELLKLPPDMPVAVRRFSEDGAVGEAHVDVLHKRRACQETIDGFSGAVHWFNPGTTAAIWNEHRGGVMEQVAVIVPG